MSTSCYWMRGPQGPDRAGLQDALVIGSRLDADAGAQTCRLAMAGRVVALIDPADHRQLARLRLFKVRVLLILALGCSCCARCPMLIAVWPLPQRVRAYRLAAGSAGFVLVRRCCICLLRCSGSSMLSPPAASSGRAAAAPGAACNLQYTLRGKAAAGQLSPHGCDRAAAASLGLPSAAGLGLSGLTPHPMRCAGEAMAGQRCCETASRLQLPLRAACISRLQS